MSRETELYKDKIEVSLDGRQIFYLFFGGAVIVGMVFVLGVMVGRRVEARGHVERAHAGGDRRSAGRARSARRRQRPVVPGRAARRRAADERRREADRRDGRGDEGGRQEARGEGRAPEPKIEEKPTSRSAEAKPRAEDREEARGRRPTSRRPRRPTSEGPTSDKKSEASKKTDGDKKSDGRRSRRSAQADSAQAREEDASSRCSCRRSRTSDEAQAFLDRIKAQGFSASMTRPTSTASSTTACAWARTRSVDAANDAKAEFEKSSKKSALVTKL